MRYVCTDKPRKQVRVLIWVRPVVVERKRAHEQGDRMVNQSNDLLDESTIGNVRQMKDLSHRLCTAPMMDR